MAEISLSVTDILNHMSGGAILHRGWDEIKLHLADRAVSVPVAIFDQLIDEGRIVTEGGGFYLLA